MVLLKIQLRKSEFTANVTLQHVTALLTSDDDDSALFSQQLELQFRLPVKSLF